jgi:hypothetical protein
MSKQGYNPTRIYKQIRPTGSETNRWPAARRWIVIQRKHKGEAGDGVGDEQTDARHLQGPDQWIELVVLDLNAAAEGSLEGANVRRGDRAPTHRVQEPVHPMG